MKAAALAFSSVWMLPVTLCFWLGYVRTVTVGTMSSKHLLIKPMTDVMYYSMPLEESRNIFQSVLAKQSCSLASASSDHFFIDLVTGEGELCMHLCVWSIGGLSFLALKSPATRSTASG
jgi:hypothetical protein